MVDPATGADVVEGYAVSVDPYWERVYNEPVIADDLVRYLTDADRALALPGRVLSGWRDLASGQVWLFVAVVVRTLSDALTLGRAAGQAAVFDLANGKSVPVPDGPDATVIPLGKSYALDDASKCVTDGGVWRYHERRRGKSGRIYSGHVSRVNGGEGKRIRGELAAAVLDLLNWADARRSSDERNAA
ncbi:hypothetical protein [Actinokineospora enzanensis]|uniref:hypothetical protein n=1 Tax=Actinokineospora enzanensis TaxID=155975 RepID=UPI00036E1632|nr:hypothetical protein [Actinokineospora enzanensis]